MKVLQINAIYERFSTGRSTKEMHDFFLSHGIDSYVASPRLFGLKERGYQIGNKCDWKIHALLSRVTGLQGYYSRRATKALIDYITKEKFEIIIFGNLHSNYINLRMIMEFIAKEDIPSVFVLHDCWFFTGKCVYYIETGCDKWKCSCGKCPARNSGNKSLFFDRSSKMLADKKEIFSNIKRKAIVGVSDWVTEDAKQSILQDARIIKRIYNWIDLDLFQPKNKEKLKEKYGYKGKTILFGVAMSWSTLKGIDVFNGMADLLSDDFLIILAGDNSGLQTKHPNIEFIGNLSNIEILSDYYSMADVFVNPSLQETFGKTTAEAMACGTPVVAYDSTATPELVGRDGNCGILINNLQPESYIDAIQKIINGDFQKYRVCSRKRAELLFDKEKNMLDYLNICKDLLNEE